MQTHTHSQLRLDVSASDLQEEKQQSILRLEREKTNLQEVHRKGIEDLMAINHALTVRAHLVVHLVVCILDSFVRTQ